MKFKYPLLLLTLVLLAITLSACAGGGASPATSWPGLSVYNGIAYVAFNQYVYAINVESGQEIWPSFPEEGNAQTTFYAAPVMTPDGQLLVGGYDRVLYSLNPETGKIIWKFPEDSESDEGAKGSYIGSPLVTEDGIFAPNADNSLYALDFDGKLKWKFTNDEPLWAQPVADPECTCIYVSSMDHRIYAVDAKTGELKWNTDELGGSVAGTPAYSSDNIIYAGSFGGEMFAIGAENGQILWPVLTEGWVWGGPILREKTLYFGDLNGVFYSMSVNDGNVEWQIQADGQIPESPLVTDEAIYFSSEDGTLHGANFNGSEFCSETFEGSKLITSPVQSGDLILVSPTNSNNLQLIALDKNCNPVRDLSPEEE